VAESEEWHRENSRRAHTNYRLFREIQQRELVQAREAMPLDRRVRQIKAALLIMQHQPAANIDMSGARSADSTHLPSIDDGIGGYLEPHTSPTAHRQDHLCGDCLIEALDDPDGALEACRALEAAVDAHRGFLRHTASDTSTDTRIITDYVGWTPSEILRADASLGPLAAIRRARILADRRPETGEPYDD
jgi:hypothetical protein